MTKELDYEAFYQIAKEIANAEINLMYPDNEIFKDVREKTRDRIIWREYCKMAYNK